MPYLYVKQQVENFDKWYKIFTSHEEAQKEAGLYDLKLMRDINDPNIITCIFKIESIEKAKAFTNAPQASEAQVDSGIIGDPTVLWLNEI